jgi:thiol:disulfide interchange protein DsbC
MKLFNPLAGCTAASLLIFMAPAGAAVPEQYEFVTGLFPDVEVTDVRESVLPGFLEMEVGADIFYVTADGKYLMQGDVYDIATKVNITDNAKTGSRIAILEQFDDSKSILFAADDPITTVTVFTDIDCGYCRKLHREIQDYNDLGISVRYLFFPRSGPGTESWAKAESVWCAESPKAALTLAKNNEEIVSAPCDASVVAEHYGVVDELGLRGTPAIITQTGVLLIGYKSPAELLEIIAADVTTVL